MFLVIIAYVIILYVYSVCPFLIQLVGFGLNAMAPDPIPFLDEIFIIWYIGSLMWGFNNWDIRSCIGEYYKNMIEATCIVDKKLRSETDEW